MLLSTAPRLAPGEYVIKRNDPIGLYALTASVSRKRDGAVCNAKQITVTVLDGASSAIVDEVRASCAPIGGKAQVRLCLDKSDPPREQGQEAYRTRFVDLRKGG